MNSSRRSTTWPLPLLVLFLIPLLAVPLGADPGEVRSLGDHFTGEDHNPDSSPQHFTPLGSLTLFVASDKQHGRELWVTDGTAQGTSLVKDIYPGPLGSSPTHLTPFDGRVYFQAQDNSSGKELWSTDGTPEGTALVADLNPGANESGSPNYLAAAGDTLYFAATTLDEGTELWKLPAGGTPVMVEDLRPGPDSSAPFGLVAWGGSWVAFSAYTPDTGREFVISNGLSRTDIFDLEPGTSGSSPRLLVGEADRVIFAAHTTADGRELYGYYGLNETLCQLADAYPGSTGSDPREAVRIGGDVYFTGETTTGPRRLLRAASNCSGAFHVVHDGDSAGLTSYSGSILFEVDGDLWNTTGSGAATTASQLATPGIVGYYNGSGNVFFVPWNGLLWFQADGGVWSTDGTSGGTDWEYGCVGCPGTIDWLQAGADALYASIDNEFVGREPYRAPIAHFSLLKDIGRDIGNSVPSEFTTLGSHVLFPAYTDDEGRELLAWDGGSGPAELVEDLEPGDDDANPQRLMVAGSKLYYSASAPTVGFELRFLEDPSLGSTMVADLGGGVALGSLGDQLLFYADDADGVYQLWETTGLGATQLSSFPDGPSTGIYQADHAIAAGGQLYYTADDGVHGDELWTTDGISTDLVVDLEPGPAPGLWPYRSAHAGLLYFAGSDGTQDGLWRTDGTIQNTVLAAAMPGIPTMSIGPNLIFWGYTEATGYEPWITDGTFGNESQLVEVNPGVQHGLYIYGLDNWTVSDGKGYFQANNAATGVELWVTDGTPSGTSLLRDIAPGPLSSEPWYITPLPNGDVVFTAWSPGHGYELWRSNGTTSGTYRVTDLAPGPDSSFPSEPEVFGNWVVFSAWSGVAGREPWAYDWSGDPFLFGDGFETGDTSAW